MASLPGQLDFAVTEEDICRQWKDEGTFATQNRLSLERGDEVRAKHSALPMRSVRIEPWIQSLTHTHTFLCLSLFCRVC